MNCHVPPDSRGNNRENSKEALSPGGGNMKAHTLIRHSQTQRAIINIRGEIHSIIQSPNFYWAHTICQPLGKQHSE